MDPATSGPHSTGASHVKLQAAGELSETNLSASSAALPSNPGPTVTQEVFLPTFDRIKENKKFGGAILRTYVNNAVSTVKLMKSAFEIIGKKWVEVVKKESGLSGVVFASIGALLSGGSLLAQAAIKAVIWTPILVLTGAGALIGGVIGGAVGAALGSKEKALAGFKLGAEIGAKDIGLILGFAGTVVSGLSIVARWPLMLTAEIGDAILQVEKPDNSDKNKIVSMAHVQAYQDALDLWVGGFDSPWDIILNEDESKRTSKIMAALSAGANPYAGAWRDSRTTTSYEHVVSRFAPKNKQK